MVADTGVSSSGSISWHESPDNLTAPTLPKWYPEFEKFIEPGARALCSFFVRDCGWITYTSCEGHPGTSASGPRSLRHVGILPRDATEYETIHGFLAASVKTYRQRATCNQCVHLAILKHQLMDPCRTQDVLDIEFSPVGGQDGYFTQLDPAVEQYLAGASHLLARGWSHA